MQVNEYQKAAMATLNPALDKKDVLINSVMGLCGESGEAIDIVKKWLMQGHELVVSCRGCHGIGCSAGSCFSGESG